MNKLNKLFAILIAVLGVGTLSGQTDVTNQYLINPGFEENYWEYTKPNTDRAIYKPKGWSVEYKNGDTNDMTFVATSMNQDGKKWDAKDGRSFFTRQRWTNSTITLYQTLTSLLPGKYTLTFDAALFGAGSSVLTILGTEPEVIKNLSIGKNDPASWTSITQDFEITSETPNVTIKIASTREGNNFKSAYDNFRLSYDGTSYYETYINAIEALYDDNKDWAVEVNALKEAIDIAKNKANKTEAIIELEKAVDAFRTANSIDMTSRISNPNFDSNISGWTTSGSDGTWQRNSSSQTNFSGGFIETWRNGWGGTWNHKNFDIHQDLTGLPNGEYTISANIIAALQGSGGPYLRSKNEGVWMYGSSSKENKEAFAATEDAAATWGEGGKLITVRVKVTDGKLTIGAKAMGSTNGGTSLGTYCNWFACDNWKLSYMGFDPSTLQSELMSLKEQATAIIKENKVPLKYKEDLQTLVNKEIGNTKKELDASIDEITLFLNSYTAVTTAYTKFKELFVICEGIIDNSVEFNDGAKTAFSTAISIAKTDVEKTTAADAINTIYNNLEAARQTYVVKADPTNETYFDYTYKIKNAAVANGNDWTGQRTNSGQQYTDAPDNTYFDSWNGAGQDIYQELTGLPSGLYTLTAAGRASTACTSAYIYINDTKAEIEKVGNAGNDLGNGWKWFTTAKTAVNGTAKIGFKANTANSQWAGADDFKLYYYGFDVPTAQEGVTNLKSKAEELVEKPMNADVLTKLNDAIAAADATKTTRIELNTMIDALDAAITAAKASIADYVLIKKYIDKAKKFDDDDDELMTLEGQYNSGSFTNAEPVRQALNVWTYNYVATNFKNEIALTEWSAESNAMWATSGQHWDGTTGEGCTSYYDANGTNTTHTLSKTVELTPGTYVFRGAGRSHPNTTLSLSIDIDGFESVTFKAKDNTGYGIDKSGAANFSEGGTYANDDNKGCGWEWEFIKFTLNENTTVTLTATCQSSGWGWASFANNGLWMDDATYVIANASSLTTPLASAKELVEKPMGNNEKDALTSAITQAEGEITTPKQLDDAVEALNKAINEAKPSIETYATIKTYIDKADKIDASIATDYTDYKSQYDNGSIAETATKVFQALEVATYKYVTENFNYAVSLSSTWNSTGTNTSAADVKGEHWSDDKEYTYKNQFDGWGDPKQGYPANSWTIDFDQEVTLPAGEYVFKVAGRKSVDATLELVVTMGETVLGTVNDFPSSNEALGINKAGATSFDADDPAGFAKDGKGYGWQWRYVKFTLTNEATVKVAIHAETDKQYNFVSFGDYTLQMTEETYLEAEKGGLVAPTAAAEALVDTKPMGEVENQALKDALGMTYTTGAELKAKKEAIETAVANANAWVVAYNKAKAPLIAAFERFETDFNDGANGTLRPMSNEAWTTLLEAVKVAALAKDVTDSYDDFEQAAEDFNTAMNAAEKAILQYSGTSFIKNAECISNEAWIGTGRSVQSGEHWSGDETREYFAQNFDPGVARTQEVKLPCSGWYVLKVSIRAVNANSYANIVINGKNNKVMGAHGRTGGTIATDGTEWESVAAGIAAGKTFANDNKGYGWVYKYIPFYVENDGDVVTIAIGLSNKDQNRLANCGGMELYYKGDNCIVKDGTIVKHYGKFADQQVVTNTTHDVTNAELDNKIIDVTANPNALIIANEGQVSNANNVIVNGNAASLVLTEGYAFNATADFTATELNYAREFSDNWLTVCLPFAYEIPENVKVETLSAVDLDTKTFTFEEVNETMEANKPYIIKNSTGASALFASLNNAEVKATPEAMAIEITANGSEHKAEFIGTYTTVKTNALMEITDDAAKYDILFFGSDGQLYYLSHGVTTKVVNIKPFRAYIRLPKGAIDWTDGQQAIARHGKGTSSIDDVQYTDDNATIIYDLMGRKVTTMVKGNMYIINGRKVIVK